jgi:hypothetical protein
MARVFFNPAAASGPPCACGGRHATALACAGARAAAYGTRAH